MLAKKASFVRAADAEGYAVGSYHLPVEALAVFLRALPATLAGNVGLAVVLEAGTALPESPALEDDGVPICTGLPDPDSDADDDADDDAVDGALEPADIVGALGPLRAAAAVCVGATPGPGARGGRLSLAARIGAGGRVIAACVTADSTDDAHLRACIVRAAQAVVFPDPHGVIDFVLPLQLVPGAAHHQRPLCE